jgi:hypothetical protein
MIDGPQSMVYVINAGGVEMAQETGVEMLDFTKPPPGYRISGPPSQKAQTDAAIVGAWGTYKREHDPPGMWSEWEADDKHFDPMGDGDWTVDFANTDGFRINAAHGRHPSSGGPEFARSAAWAWHDRRHALALRDKAAHQNVKATMAEYLAMTDADCDVAGKLIAADERAAAVRRARDAAS